VPTRYWNHDNSFCETTEQSAITIGPVTTVVVDAVSYLFSAIGIGAIHGRESLPKRTDVLRLRVGDLLEGWRYILTHPTLRPLFFNTALVNGLIMATSPLVAVLMLGHLGFKPWQYGLRRYTPDYSVAWSDGKREIVEVKYLSDLRANQEGFKERFAAMGDWACTRGATVRVATEREIRGCALENAKRLLPLRTAAFDPDIARSDSFSCR
jgi:hypothetical protein